MFRFGILIFLLMVVYLVYRNVRSMFSRAKQYALVQEFYQSELSNYNLNNFGYWVNSAGLILTMNLLIYTLFKKPDYTTSDENALLTALIILLPIIFLLFNIGIRVKSQGKFLQKDQTDADTLQ